MNYKAILFDLDGTLINSADLFYTALSEVLCKKGEMLDKQFFDQWQSRRGTWLELLENHYSIIDNSDALEEEAMHYFNQLLRTESKWMPGVESLLSYLKKEKIPAGIVTNAYEHFVDTLSERFHFNDLFSVIVTSAAVGHRLKPDPYGLLLAADQLGMRPEDIVYVGDQLIDIHAAQAAGMESWFFSFSSDISAPDLQKNTRSFTSFHDIELFLKNDK